MPDTRVCVQCSDPFERAPGTNRMRCFKCSPARITAHGATQLHVAPTAPAGDQGPLQPPPDQPHEPGTTEKMARAELEALGEADTLEGVLIMGLAYALDDQWLPGAQRVSMIREMKATMEQIREKATPKEVDTTDYWAERAMERARGAGAG